MKNCGPDDEARCETSEKAERVVSRSDIVRASAGISRRLLDLFDYQNISEIVFQLKFNISEIEAVIECETLPSAEMLLSIQKVTGVSLDWLLTGQGNKFLPLMKHVVPDNVRLGPWIAERERIVAANAG